jgi:hypothetical protein
VLIEATRPLTTIASWGSWEFLLPEAGYEFVYFDGLNRFYVAAEHRELNQYFSVPVSTCDPLRDGEVVRLSGIVPDLEHDKVRHACERADLSAAISELQRNRMNHEVPRLGGGVQMPIPCDARDAAGLLRIVEAQASDLVRLRRSLVSAQTVAA